MTINAVQALELVGNLYEAALDAALWPEVFQRCAQALDADCGVLFVHDFAHASAQVQGAGGALAASWGCEPAIASYDAHSSMRNVWAENEIKISFMRSSQAGAYCTEELALWQTVMRHLQRAIELHQQAQALAMRSEDCLAALDLVPQGIVLLSVHGEVKHTSCSAQSLLATQRGLYVDRAGTLRSASSAQDNQLQRLVRSAATTHSAVGGWRRVADLGVPWPAALVCNAFADP